jgi:hypothetical protein
MRNCMQVKKLISVAALSVGLVGGGAGSASAGAFNHATTGANINGSHGWQPRSVHQGAFDWNGTLQDTLHEGNAVKMEVAVEGYGFNEFQNPVDQNKGWNQDVWDFQALQTNHARAKVCRDRGTTRVPRPPVSRDLRSGEAHDRRS